MSYFQFGGTYLFDDDSDGTAPFISLTAGLTRYEPGLDDTDAESYFSWSLGGGVQLRADRRIGVRLEARAVRLDHQRRKHAVLRVSPSVNGCALSVEGDILYQFEARVGIVARF